MGISAQFTFSSTADRSGLTHLLLKKFSLSFKLYQQFELRTPKPAVLILYIGCATPSDLLCKGKRKAGLYEQLPLLHMLQITSRSPSPVKSDHSIATGQSSLLWIAN